MLPCSTAQSLQSAHSVKAGSLSHPPVDMAAVSNVLPGWIHKLLQSNTANTPMQHAYSSTGKQSAHGRTCTHCVPPNAQVPLRQPTTVFQASTQHAQHTQNTRAWLVLCAVQVRTCTLRLQVPRGCATCSINRNEPPGLQQALPVNHARPEG